MTSIGRIFHTRYLLLIAILLLLPSTFYVRDAEAAITATRTSAPVFYTHSGAGTPTTSPVCTYLSFDVTSTTAIDDAWVSINNFSGAPAYLSLGGGDDGKSHFGPMSAGETRAAFFYVCSSYSGKPVVTGQGYDLSTYSGNPSFGGTLINTTPFTTSIDDDVIQANPNTVNSIWADINPSILGATTTLTVDGDTGTIGCVNPPSVCTGAAAGPLTFNPATFLDWRADAYELVATNVTLSVGNSGSFDNQLYLDNLPSSSNTHYVATYYFRPVATTESTTTLSPVSYIASGTKIKHTSLSSGAYAVSGGLLPILPAENVIVLSKSASHATLPAQGGIVTYTINATNTGSHDLTLDSFNDVMPAGASYVTGSTTFNDTAFVDPLTSGSNLTWSSFFTIPAGTTRKLIYQLLLPATPGIYTNSATARIDLAVIDTTLSTADVAPATSTTTVLKAPVASKSFMPTALAIGSNSALTITISNPNSSHDLTGVAISDTLPAGLVFAVPSGASTTCTGASLNVASGIISISGASIPAASSCTVSANVTSSSNAIYTNTTSAVTSNNGGTGNTASALIEFSSKPTITKSFSTATITQNGIVSLSFTITNNTATPLTGVTFSDLFPSGLVLPIRHRSHQHQHAGVQSLHGTEQLPTLCRSAVVTPASS